MASTVLRKVLSRNDLGLTGSHQSGFLVPKSMRSFFPELDEALLNPSCLLTVVVGRERLHWRFVHYNGKLMGRGTRNEFRVTRAFPGLALLGASAGDTLELTGLGSPSDFRAELARASFDEDTLTLSSDGPWTLIRLSRP